MDATPEEPKGDPKKEVFISTLRYYPIGPLNCAVCGKPGEVVRLASSPQGDIIVTVMCNACGKRESDGLLKDGEMVEQGGMLVNVNFIAMVNEAARVASENADSPPEKVPEELEGETEATDG